jgi:hypothetical protein
MCAGIRILMFINKRTCPSSADLELNLGIMEYWRGTLVVVGFGTLSFSLTQICKEKLTSKGIHMRERPICLTENLINRR